MGRGLLILSGLRHMVLFGRFRSIGLIAGPRDWSWGGTEVTTGPSIVSVLKKVVFVGDTWSTLSQAIQSSARPKELDDRTGEMGETGELVESELKSVAKPSYESNRELGEKSVYICFQGGLVM